MIPRISPLALALVFAAGLAAAQDQFATENTTFSCDSGLGKPLPFLRECREEAPGFQMRGPEFDDTRFRATWWEYVGDPANAEGIVYIAEVDRETGVIDALGAEMIVSNIAPPNATNQGPEWADSQRGPEVFFTCTNAEVDRTKLCRINSDLTVDALPGTVGYSIRSIGQDRDNPVPKVYFELRSGTFTEGQLKRVGFGWREDGADPVDRPVFRDSPVKGGRWLPDGDTVLFSALDTAPETGETFINVFINDTERGFVRPLAFATEPTRSRTNPKGWEAPELGGKIAFTTLALVDNNPKDWELHVYRQTSGLDFELWNVIEPICPDAFPLAANPTPFVFGGRSYLAGLSVPATGDLNQDVGIIWVESVDPSLPEAEQVSRLVSNDTCLDDNGVVRKDPEALVLEDSETGEQIGARIYYTVRVLD